MKTIFRIFLTLCSLSFCFFIFAYKNPETYDLYIYYVGHILLGDYYEYSALSVMYTIVVLFILYAITKLCIYMTRFLDDEEIEKKGILSISSANDQFLPTYLGYFFIALSVSNFEMYTFIFSIIFIFVHFSQVSYFNPIFLLLGYNFFYINDCRNVNVIIITKKQLKEPEELEFKKLKKVNEYTFFDMEEEG